MSLKDFFNKHLNLEYEQQSDVSRMKVTPSDVTETKDCSPSVNRRPNQTKYVETNNPLEPDHTFQLNKGTDLPIFVKDDTGHVNVSPRPFIFEKPIIYHKRSVIIFVIENSLQIKEYSKEFSALINKVLLDNKDNSLFLFLKTGCYEEFFKLANYDEIIAKNIPQGLFDANNTILNINLLKAIQHIESFTKYLDKKPKTIMYNDKPYEITDTRIVFIGTGLSDSNENAKNEASIALKKLLSKKDINTIKYFCINDTDAINAALTGFPIIGHIESNFYK